MYIRKTKTADHGKDSTVKPTHWPLLSARIEEFLQGSSPHQSELIALADDVGQLLEASTVR
jgi:hypothetical protein